MSEILPKNISEKDVRKYIRKNILKNIFIEWFLLNSSFLGAWRLT